MVAFSFKSQFAGAVESGRKKQTIRGKVRCKPGDALQLYTGMRTKQCRKLADAVCKQVRPVRISVADGVWLGPVLRDAGALSLWEASGAATRKSAYTDRPAADRFARDDGFLNFKHMMEWFKEQYGSSRFVGYLVKW